MTDLLRSALPIELDDTLKAAIERSWIVAQAKAGLKEARRAPAYATTNLSRWFRRNRSLGSKDRPIVGALVHGVIRHEAILLRSGARSPEELIVGVAALFAGDRLTDLEPVSEAEDLATALNVPAAVANEWLSRLGPDDAAAFAASLNTRPPRDIRVNLAKTSPHALQAALAKEGVTTEIRDTVTTLLEVVGRANLTNTKAFKAGLFEVQDRSSQILCAALNVEPGMRVLDLCAGAGGKSLALAALGAEVTATDIRSKALDELEKRAARSGAQIAIEEPSPAPLVLIDAPCSGSGRLRRNPALRWGLHAEPHLEVQRALLDDAAALVEPDGALVYATCSLLQAENSHLCPAGFETVEERRLWPHVDASDGFYWRVMRRV